MKVINRIISLLLVFFSCSVLLTGCTYKEYKLIGIVFEGDSKITKLENITDEKITQYLTENYNNNITINLKSNNNYVMSYSVVDAGLTVTYTQRGTFELKEKEETIIFTTPRGDGSTRSSTQQYSNGAIIYFDGLYYLAFK